MSNIDFDQKIRPRAMSQSHRPQRPRSSALSSRSVATDSVRSASAARAACQWNAAPSSTSTPSVTTNSVTICATSERQAPSTASRG